MPARPPRAPARRGRACTPAATSTAPTRAAARAPPPRAARAGRVVSSSRDKHGSYVSGCQWSCFDACEIGSGDDPPMVNAGEPDAHLIEDLTSAGLITEEAGWSEPSL